VELGALVAETLLAGAECPAGNRQSATFCMSIESPEVLGSFRHNVIVELKLDPAQWLTINVYIEPHNGVRACNRTDEVEPRTRKTLKGRAGEQG
jgi:hypothetical protein